MLWTDIKHWSILSLTFSSWSQTSVWGCHLTSDLCHDPCWQHRTDGTVIPAGQSSWPRDPGAGPSWRRSPWGDWGKWHRLAQMTGTLQEQHGSSVSFSATPAVLSRGIFAQCPQRPVGLSEMGTSGKAGKKSETSRQGPTPKTKAAMDRLQNNGMLKQCLSGSAQRPHNCCPNCYTEQSQRQCP